MIKIYKITYKLADSLQCQLVLLERSPSKATEKATPPVRSESCDFSHLAGGGEGLDFGLYLSTLSARHSRPQPTLSFILFSEINKYHLTCRIEKKRSFFPFCGPF